MGERILVIKPSSLGDIIHGLLVAESIRQQMPGVQIDWVARDIFAPLVEACETVSEVHHFYRGAGLGAFGQLIQDIREIEYDTVLDMQGLARSGVMAMFSGTPRRNRIGRRDAREGGHWGIGRRVKLPPAGADAHAVDILREFLPALGLRNELLGKLVFAPPAEPLPDLPENYWLIFPGSRRAEKEWPGFAELSVRILEENVGTHLVWGGDVAVDSPTTSNRLINLTGKTRLSALPAIIQGAALVVCNDSGPMHLAAALQRPVLGVFGPTSPLRFGPYPPGRTRNRTICGIDGKIDGILVEEVLQNVYNLKLSK